MSRYFQCVPRNSSGVTGVAAFPRLPSAMALLTAMTCLTKTIVVSNLFVATSLTDITRRLSNCVVLKYVAHEQRMYLIASVCICLNGQNTLLWSLHVVMNKTPVADI